jgi:hypothetical protein
LDYNEMPMILEPLRQFLGCLASAAPHQRSASASICLFAALATHFARKPELIC